MSQSAPHAWPDFGSVEHGTNKPVTWKVILVLSAWCKMLERFGKMCAPDFQKKCCAFCLAGPRGSNKEGFDKMFQNVQFLSANSCSGSVQGSRCLRGRLGSPSLSSPGDALVLWHKCGNKVTKSQWVSALCRGLT